jgi:hypothetical protein
VVRPRGLAPEEVDQWFELAELLLSEADWRQVIERARHWRQPIHHARRPPMDEDEVFAFLKKHKKTVFLDFLHTAFDEMTAKQRRAVFAEAIRKAPRPRIDGEWLREESELFRQDSLARRYYAPFAINSKNFMHVP